MGTVVLDAGVVLGLLDPQDPNHQGAGRAVRASRTAGQQLVLPACVLAEILVAADRMGEDAAEKAEEFVEAIVDAVHGIDGRVAHEAAACLARHPELSLRDAFVIAVGRVRGADAILTTDPAWRGVDKRVKLIPRRRRQAAGDTGEASLPGF
jgi:predicted nucleic acid-binding protein